MKKITVTIGIPAYNEEQNIKRLLKSLFSQRQESFVLEEIIIVNDGSTDNTRVAILEMKNKNLILIENSKRLGQQISQNKIIKHFKGEVLVLIEADTLPYDENTIEFLVKEFFRSTNSLGMVVGYPVPISPQKFYEKVLFHGMQIKHHIFYNWKDGINIYTCPGQAMKALSRLFIKFIDYPPSVPEDSYTYLLLKKNKFEMRVSKNARVYMRNVTSIGDRVKQASKYVSGKKNLNAYFGEKLVKNEYDIPKVFVIKTFLKYFINYPFWTVFYAGDIALNRFLTPKKQKFSRFQSTNLSSKNLQII